MRGLLYQEVIVTELHKISKSPGVTMATESLGRLVTQTKCYNSHAVVVRSLRKGSASPLLLLHIIPGISRPSELDRSEGEAFYSEIITRCYRIEVVSISQF